MNFHTVLLLVLTQYFLTTLANNVTSDGKTLAKVLTSFLKVPWIDLSSSWTDVVSSTCKNDIVTLFESADNGEMWALQMLDAASKLPAGILTGNIFDYGMFDECINVKSHSNAANIEGQHCVVSLSMPTKFYADTSKMMRIQKLNIFNPSSDVDLSLSMSVCVPSSCDIQDINGLVNASIENMPELSAFEVGVAKVACSSFEPSRLTTGSILTISFFAIVAILILLCTACDFILRAKYNDGSIALKNAAKFSLYTNTIKLMSTKLSSGCIPAIHGIRVVSMLSIITAHRSILVILKAKTNLSEFNEMLQSTMSSILFTILFGVDTFFLISSFLMAHSFLKKLRSGKQSNLFVTFFHRYIRLTPSIAVVLLVVIFIIPYFKSGPIWKNLLEEPIANCQKNWWTNLLYVQNIVNVDEMCLLHTWSLAVEMQLFCLSPIILYQLFYRPKLGLVLLILLLVASCITPAVLHAVNGWSALAAIEKKTVVLYSELLKSYTATYNRALPYLLGILLGYDVIYNKRQISKIQVAFNWILACFCIIFCVWSSSNVQPVVQVYNVVWESTYVSVTRLSWSIAMAWIIYASTQGYGGPVTTILSLPVFIPISRLSYNIYLVHLVLQMVIAATERIGVHVTYFSEFYLIWGDLAVSSVIAFILYLFFEIPIITMEKVLRSHGSSACVKHGSPKEHTRLSARVKKYLDRSENSFNTDFAIETITIRLDFWQAISDELNTLAKGSPKTPAEWSKIWQDWRSKLSKINGTSKTESKSIRKKKTERQAGVVALEKELMVFAAAVNCGSTNSTSSIASDIAVSESQSQFNDQQHANTNPFDDTEKQLSRFRHSSRRIGDRTDQNSF